MLMVRCVCALHAGGCTGQHLGACCMTALSRALVQYRPSQALLVRIMVTRTWAVEDHYIVQGSGSLWLMLSCSCIE